MSLRRFIFCLIRKYLLEFKIFCSYFSSLWIKSVKETSVIEKKLRQSFFKEEIESNWRQFRNIANIN